MAIISARPFRSIPHVTNAIKDFILAGNEGVDFVLVEIGGTVGDIEGLPFFEAIRQLGNDLPRGHALYIHLTLLPFIPSAGELKTKPTQHSVKELRSIGIQPRYSAVPHATARSRARSAASSALFCNVRESAVIEARDVASIYDVPRAYHAAGLDQEVLAAFGIEPAPKPDMTRWNAVMDRVSNPEGEVTIAIVGKYTGLKDAYKSLIEALTPWRHRQPHQCPARLDRVGDFRERRPRRPSRPCARHPRSGRLRPARRGRQNPCRPLRARAQSAVFRHLLRHADGGDRSGAIARRRQGGQFDRVRADAASLSSA